MLTAASGWVQPVQQPATVPQVVPEGDSPALEPSEATPPPPGSGEQGGAVRRPAAAAKAVEVEDVADLDISDDDGAVAAAGGADSEVDEDWGSWE